MDFVDVENICRTCINKQEIKFKLKDTMITLENTCISVLEILNLFTEVKITEHYPDEICSHCLEEVRSICKFKLQLENSESVLRQIEMNKQISDVSDNDAEIGTQVYIKNESPEQSLINEDSQNQCLKNEKDVGSSKLDEQQKQDDVTHAAKAKSFRVKRKKVKNITQESSDECDMIEPYVCTLCNKTFKTKYILTTHNKRHKYKGQFLCTLCGKGFNSQNCLNRHMRGHTGEKKYECEICHKRFPSSNNLNLHIRTHTGAKPYLCSTCGKAFRNRTGLNFHLRTHTGVKPYVCDICGKSFAAQSHYNWHRMIHTGERPFPCSMCDKAFIKKVDLQRHEAIHSNVKPFECTYCQKTFRTKMHLQYHVMIHTEERPHKCQTCGKGFIRRYYLKDHITKHHEGVDLGDIKNEKNLVHTP